MRFSLFYHSLVSDWNHGNAHFLRGVVSELQAGGHQVTVYEPSESWSRENLDKEQGTTPLAEFSRIYPQQRSIRYTPLLDLEKVMSEADVIIVHEWNEPWLVNGLGRLHNRLQKNGAAGHRLKLLFHDTHHRAVSDSSWLRRFRLDFYDGILSFGQVLSDIYRSHGWSESVWTWHEAADTRVFFPRQPDPQKPDGELVWVGNWGDEERSRELHEFLIEPAHALGLQCHIYGVRYPLDVLRLLQQKNIDYYGWTANFHVPFIFANHRATVHIPRRYYATKLPGIPTIRPFEALACGIPLVSAPWQDSENLFQPGLDFLVAGNGREMKNHLRAILNDRPFAEQLAAHGLATIKERHTCAHRVKQLLQILVSLGAAKSCLIPDRSALFTSDEVN